MLEVYCRYFLGLKIHDAIAETSDDITHATTRLPHDLQEARYRRMIRASDILVKRKFFHAKERAEVNVIDVSHSCFQ